MLNPFAAVRYAIIGQMKLASKTGLELYLPDRDVRHAAQTVAQSDDPLGKVDDSLRRIAKGPRNSAEARLLYPDGKL